MELWDLYDENRKLINKLHNRENPMVHSENHIVVDIWTVNSNYEVLLTLRHPDKKDYPDCWENTGGSILAGENSKQGAVRELFEETGIIACENELHLLGTQKEPTAFVDSYIVRKDIKISELTMQDGETVGAKWVSLRTLDEMISDGSIAYPVSRRLKPVRKEFERFLFGK